MKQVTVIGTGMTKFGTLADKSLKQLLLEASFQALKEASFPKIDAVFIGNFMSGALANQEILGSLIAHDLGLGPIPTVKMEGACASGGIAFRHACEMIEAGIYDTVLVAGGEKMKHAQSDVVMQAINAAMDTDSNEKKVGLSFPGFFGILANRYFYETEASKKHLALVALKNREYARNNPNAQYRDPATLDEIMNARMITEPLGLFDCSPITDGAAAIVLTRGDKGISVIASSQASGPTQAQEVEDLLTISAINQSASMAYEQAGLGPDDIDVIELHDCFSMTEILAIEALGLAKRGEGWKLIEAEQTKHGGKVPVNTSGGLLSRGHPIGATGLAQIYQVVQQLRGTACNQVEGARIALAQNLGGTGSYSTVHIFTNGR
ncbi:acetyl-CoA acetyltransferase [Heyndrickxia sporothermodurans]|uniref:thiolase C-terminal domain-containing protein n=1 Tax=Heyndrickxia sporothermodurans TaxID=46224 RepID=UPI000D382C7D|nr:beta-ketoacyl synthase N-terminal-like domain-containing protein [Heyndrickxia sporothermodurans]PTY76752.1 acetyl-CoA acetyltransferase [Heyndrickxia sporothermodurans]